MSGYPFVKQHPIALRMVSMTPNTQYPQYIMPSYHGILGVETGMFYFDAPTTFDTGKNKIFVLSYLKNVYWVSDMLVTCYLVYSRLMSLQFHKC